MDNAVTVGLIVGGIILALLLVRIFFAPIRIIFKLMLNTLLGGVALAAINFLGGFVGLSLGFNLVNCAVTGIFGLPGVIFLLLMRWLTGT